MTLLDVALSAEPAYLVTPPAVSSAVEEAVDLAASAGLILDPWQRDVLGGALGERPDGRWAATEVGLVVPRQNGKNGIVEARQLAGLFLFGERLQTHTAHRFDTCLEHFGRVRELIEDTPDLDRRVLKILDSNGKESITIRDEQGRRCRLVFKARSKGSGRGFAGDTLYFDEAFYLYSTGAAVPSLSAALNPQIWFFSSAPLAGPESDALRRLCRRGRRQAREGCADRLAYTEFCADHGEARGYDELDPALLDDVGAHEDANPALGIRLSMEFCEIERGEMTVEEYARERLGVWWDDEEVPSDMPQHLWADGRRAVRSGGRLMLDPVTFAVEVSPDRTQASVSVAADAKGEAGKVAVALAWHGPYSPALEDLVVQMSEEAGPRNVVIDPKSPAGGLIRRLEAKGVPVLKVTRDDFVQACTGIYDGVIAGTVLHPVRTGVEQQALDAALEESVARARMKKYGVVWMWDRETSGTPLAAVSLAHWAHGLPVEPPPTSAYEEHDLVVV